jgi:hypothetical protein
MDIKRGIWSIETIQLTVIAQHIFKYDTVADLWIVTDTIALLLITFGAVRDRSLLCIYSRSTAG